MSTELWVQLSGFWLITAALGICGFVFAIPGPLRTPRRDRFMWAAVVLTVVGIVVYGTGVVLT